MKQYLNPKNKIPCLICGKKFFHPMSHAWQSHKILSREYKETFGLDISKGLVSSDLREVISENVKSHPEVIEKLKQTQKISCYKKGDISIGKYTRSEQTLKRLSLLSSHRKPGSKTCEDCNNEIYGYAWKKVCKDCAKKRQEKRNRSPGTRKYHKEWYREKAKDENFRKNRTSNHSEWVSKNREHLKQYTKLRSYSMGKQCSDCGVAITNNSKTGFCIHCFNKKKLINV